jgi:hypothetical protein
MAGSMRSRLLAVLAVTAAATGLAACGEEEPSLRAENEGGYVEVGELVYQVQLSRPLNPGLRSDAELLSGLTPEQQRLPPERQWFGVFVRVANETDEPRQSSSEFTIEDTTGATFEPIPVDNLIAYRPELLPPGNLIPNRQTVASFGQTQGAMLLFQVPVQTLENRPLELLVQAPEGGAVAAVDLDV